MNAALLKRLLLCLCMLGINSAYASEAVEVVIFADEAYPPYSYMENGELRGIYPALFVKFFEQMPGYKVQIKPVPWKRGLMMIETGQGFALIPPYYRPKERPWMHYSEPILEEQVTLFCNEPVLKGIRRTVWPDDFYGLRVGINAGFVLGGERFMQASKEGKLSIDLAPSNRSNLLKLLMGRIDCYLNDRLSILWELERIKSEGLYNNQKILEALTISQETAYLGVTERDNGHFAFKSDFIKQLNAQILQMKKKGEIQRLIELQLSK
jgi:polar amino acid transport system substrate-binding protein